MVDPLDERGDEIDTPDDPEAVDDEQFHNWIETHSDTVTTVLEEMTAVYSEDGEKHPIRNASISHAPPHADYVGVQMDLPAEMDPAVEGANILRLLDDLTSHEVAHKNWSDLYAKREFNEYYPGWGKIPGQVQNIVEDEYIDARRLVRWHGLRDKLAFYTWLHMNTESRAPPVDRVAEESGLENAMIAALLQTALAGYVNGIEDAPDEIAEAMARVEPLLDRVRSLAKYDEKNDIPGRETADKREKISHAVMNVLARYLPDPTNYDSDEMEGCGRETSAAPDPEAAPPSPDGEPQVNLPDETEEELEEMFEVMMNDDDSPNPLPEMEDADVDGAIEIDIDVDRNGDPESDWDGGSPGDMAEDAVEEPESSDADPGGSDENPGKTDADDRGRDGVGGDGDADERITHDLEALVETYGADNLVVEG